FGPNGHDQVIVTVDHRHVTVTADQPQNNGTKLPDNPAKTFNGVEANDLNKTIIRTIKVTTPDGQTKTIVQTAKLTRTADVDEVTGEVTYGDWTTGEWAAYDAPSVAGYIPSQAKVDQETVTAASKDTTTTITYLPTQHQISVEYVDDDDHGKIVTTDHVSGKTDQTITVTPSAPANYDLVDSSNRTYTVTSADGQTVQIHVKHHQVITTENKTVMRTINVHTPHDGVKTVKQAATLNRDVTTDQVTGDKTYGDWSTTAWDHYDVPAVAGYVPSITQVAQQVVNGTTTDQTIEVTYSSGEHTTRINYVDGSGNVVHTTTIKGQTDGTAQVPNETPAGWTVVGEPVPTEIAFGPDGHADITVTVDHQHVTVTPDQPKTLTDKLPDNPAKTYPNGVGHDDL
ncbi:peptidase, partial [Lactobacillus reuteri]|uniref:mucin-binding protein n=1 Tax=Limosilactobacillus reuteri TaxID=1598 RepID=UPI001784FD6E|nr:peptidase [Limosilactobacillus reuteri]